MLAVAAALTLLSIQDPEPAAPFARPALATLEDSGLRYRAVSIPDASHVCVVLGIAAGTDHDPPGATGLAYVLAELLRLHFEAEDRVELAIGVRALGPATVLAATVHTAHLPALLAAYRGLLDDGPRLDDDACAQAVARAKLRADDENRVLPGPILEGRARRMLFAGEPRGRLRAIAAELDALDRRALERAVAARFAPRAAFVIGVGGIETAALVEPLRGLRPRGDAGPEPAVHDSGPPLEAATPHPLVDAPFVTAAVRAPSWGEEGFVPFLIGAGVLRARAARTFVEYRGGEMRARFPFVEFGYLDDPGLVLVNRRGRDEDPVERPRAEIESLLADLRLDGMRPSEIAQATAELVQSLALPPYGRRFEEFAVGQPRALHPRAWVLAMYEVHGWPAELVELLQKSTVGDVVRTMRDALDPEAVRWSSLRPADRER